MNTYKLIPAALAAGAAIALLARHWQLQRTKNPKTHPRQDVGVETRYDGDLFRERRAKILAQPIRIQQPPLDLSSSSEIDESFDSASSGRSDDEGSMRTTKNLKLYHYYDVEIKYANEDKKDYEKNLYKGYSSFNPMPDSDSKFFKQGPVDVKRLGDWNRRFQDCIFKLRQFNLTTPLNDRIQTNLSLLHLSQDFIYAATTYGKIIISEYYLPTEKKTIKPCSLPGLMGGQKYIVHNILFKFAVDYNELFGNDYAAAKAAGNELRGLISYFNCQISNLNLPLMALVDYRGFRLIAMSILPISPDSIIYGSCDAGRHIHANDNVFNEKMMHAAKLLNLKPHQVKLTLEGYTAKAQFQQSESPLVTLKHQSRMSRTMPNLPSAVPEEEGEEITAPAPNGHGGLSRGGDGGRQLMTSSQGIPGPTHYTNMHSDEEEDEADEIQILFSPADLEGHKGRDAKYYLLDFSRVMPPETPNKGFKNSHLSRLLRPEFVQAYVKPLCSDAFSGFIRGDPNEFEHNQDIREATQHLYTVLIPKFSKELSRMMSDARQQGRLADFRLTETVHTVGIGSRHMGILRKYIVDDEFKAMLLAEIVSRAIKNNLRYKLREKMRMLRLPLEEPYRRLVIDYLNLIFGNTKESDLYWNRWLKSDIQMNFLDALTEEEAAPEFNLKLRMGTWSGAISIDFLTQVFERVKKMLGLQFNHRQFNFLAEQPFDDTDLESIGERVKHMNIIAHAQGFFYHVKGLVARVDDPTSAKKFYEIAISKYEEALDSNPNNKEILLSIALTWMLAIEEDYKGDAKFTLTDPRVRTLEEYALRAISAEPKYDSLSLFRYATFLERCNRLETAEDYYLMALEADPNNTGCLHWYGDFLSSQGFENEAEKFYMRSSKSTEGYKYRPEYEY